MNTMADSFDQGGLRMERTDVTQAVWDRVLAVKDGAECLCCGEWSKLERDVLDLYGSIAVPTETPVVFAQIGQSLDGRVATGTGDAQDVSGADGLSHLHRLRAVADAVIIGVKTALQDDPQLTVRLAKGASPARVVIDPTGRLPNDATLLQDDGTRRIIVQACDVDRPTGVEVIRLPREDWISAHKIVEALSALGLQRILVEGGATTIAQFLEAGLLARLHIAIAPLLIGSGPQGLSTTPIPTLAQARRPKTRTYNLGSDILFDCHLDPRIPTPQPCHRRQK